MFILNEREASILVAGVAVLVHLIILRHYESHVEPVHVCVLLLFIPLAMLHALPLSTNSPMDAAAYLGLYWASLLGSVLIYRVSPWHPLSKYPGPLMCKLTKFRFAFISLNGKQHLEYTRLHDQYGDIVRVGPNELSIRTVDAIGPLMGMNGLPKGPFWDGRIPSDEAVRPLISIRNMSEHARRRRPWIKAFNSSALKGYEWFVSKRCLQLIEKLDKEPMPVDLAKWISYYSYDVMTDLAFGGGSEMMQNGDTNGLWQLMEAGQRNAIFMSHLPWLGMLFMKLPFFAKGLKAFRAHAKQCAAKRLRSSSDYQDMISHFVEDDTSRHDKNSLLEIINDGGLTILAGSDTVSSVVSNLFYLLMCHPTSFARLRDEIDFVADCTDCLHLAQLSYLNATINETLRLFPPVMSGSQRAPEKGSGGHLCREYFIPEGTAVFIPTYTLQRDGRYFSPFPNAFIPERWLPIEDRVHLEPGVFANRDDFILDTNAFIPFSVGAYNCVGKSFAWMEMRMLICNIVQKFDMSFPDGYHPLCWEDDICDYFITLKGNFGKWNGIFRRADLHPWTNKNNITYICPSHLEVWYTLEGQMPTELKPLPAVYLAIPRIPIEASLDASGRHVNLLRTNSTTMIPDNDETLPPYSSSDNTAAPLYTEFESTWKRSPPPLTRHLFHAGFFFPPLWLLGSIPLILPSYNSICGRRLVRQSEMKWAKRCFAAVLFCTCICIALGLSVWGILKNKKQQ